MDHPHQILHRYTNAVLYEVVGCPSTKDCLEAAVQANAALQGAALQGAAWAAWGAARTARAAEADAPLIAMCRILVDAAEKWKE